jgi:hypothetical protein
MVIDDKIIHGFNENTGNHECSQSLSEYSPFTVIREIVAAQVATMVEDIIAVASHQ